MLSGQEPGAVIISIEDKALSIPHQQHRQLPAWYFGTRQHFLSVSSEEIASQLSQRAALESLAIEAEQAVEWDASISLLQAAVSERLPIIQSALATPGAEFIRHVALEYDFRRRGLRIDAVLLAEGAIVVLEFKRSRFQRADRDQVMSYAINLLEFHEETRHWCEESRGIIVPVLVVTQALRSPPASWPGMKSQPWSSITNKPIECDAGGLSDVLQLIRAHRQRDVAADSAKWLSSAFSPSSSIVDAALSLYGNHDVSAIAEHQAPVAAIEACVGEVVDEVDAALQERRRHLIFLSGAPGAGKTLVGLELVLRGKHAPRAVFVTGNAPLVDVLSAALQDSYVAQSRRHETWVATGYRQADAHLVASAATHKIVKAHSFLGPRGSNHKQLDGQVLVFDEAQRTYEAGRRVLGSRLEDDEAALVLEAQEKTFEDMGAVVVALVGHNQVINRGETGIKSWLQAAERRGWTFSVGDQTLSLAGLDSADEHHWANHPLRRRMQNGHLGQSMRFYRNRAVDEWADAVLAGDVGRACEAANQLSEKGHAIWLTRSLGEARAWARSQIVGERRGGIVATGQARRLAAEGLFVELKPSIADWMLAPSSDIRSSSALETVQNQYQIQGLELDVCIVCWDADFRRVNDNWNAFELRGSKWMTGSKPIGQSGYRVLLTRARQEMCIFVPRGDLDGRDDTRSPGFYDPTADFLVRCGARTLPSR